MGVQKAIQKYLSQVWSGRVMDSSGCTSPIVMSCVMLSKTCTRISEGERFFWLAISVVISSIVFSPVLLSQRLAISSLLKYRELASLISTILPSGLLAMCRFVLALNLEAVVIDCNSINEPKVYNVYRNLGIIAVAERVHNSVHRERFGHES